MKGIIFDSNLTNCDSCTQEFLRKGYIKAWGCAAAQLLDVKQGDMIFLYLKGKGIVASGKVTLQPNFSMIRDDKSKTKVKVTGATCKVKWGVNLLTKEKPKGLRAGKIKTLLDKDFFWARAVKLPLLTAGDSQILAKEINRL